MRHWLMDNGYRIVHEELLHENRFYYEIIVAERTGPVTYTEEQLYFGPLHLEVRSPVFVAKWQRLLRKKQKTLASFEKARQSVPEEKLQEIARHIQWINHVLA
ncbi:tRNA A22 N-methylase [Pseudomonas sp. W4I3]|nr:tRNA A22 N-methylase [Pseudomonas sp. W4I3]